jgi:hypothetical protein
MVLVAACGSRTNPIATSEQDAMQDARRSLSGDSGAIRTARCSDTHVRICRGSLELPECPGLGCTAVLDVTSGAPEPAGVCWADAKGGDGNDLCFGCEDGEVCAQRERNKLVCVCESVCFALAAAGAATGCRYADKRAFDARPLAQPLASCPVDKAGPLKAALCGGACGDCPTYTSQRCSGRSADRPFGVCPFPKFLGSGASEMDICSVGTDGRWTRRCLFEWKDNGPYGREPAVCEVYDNPAFSDDLAAREYGLCVPRSVCQAAARAMGGIHCYSDVGVDMR